MNIKDRFYNKIRKIKNKLRLILFPTDTEKKRKWHQEEERTDRYEKYIPHFMAKTYVNIALWFPLCMFIYFMTFGISMNIHNDKVHIESRKKYKEVLKETKDFDAADIAAQEYIKNHPVAHIDPQTKIAWDYIMTPLGLDKDIYINLLILLGGVVTGLGPTISLAHRKKIVDNMHYGKFDKIDIHDKTDKKIIYNMSKDSSSYFYHIAFNSVCDEQMRKLKKIAIPIIKGHLKSHPEDLNKALATKIYQHRTKTK